MLTWRGMRQSMTGSPTSGVSIWYIAIFLFLWVHLVHLVHLVQLVHLVHLVHLAVRSPIFLLQWEHPDDMDV